MLAVKNVSVDVNRRPILDSIDLAVEPGTILAVVGPNGAGKSTLLRAIVGLLSAGRGELTYNGQNLSGLRCVERARIVAYLPQSMPGNQQYPVSEFVALGNFPWSGKGDPDELSDRINRALRLCQIEEFRARKISTLSGGERQRVYLAQVIVQKTPVVLLDEPTVFLDLKHQILFEDILVRLKNEKKSIVYVSHDLHSARRIASRVVAMKDGRIVTQGVPKQVLTPALIAQLFDAKPEIIHQWYGNGWD